MNKRGIKRQTLEPKRTELNPLASDFKTALLQAEHITTPIERVIYVNDSDYVKHVPGTNKYTINFPETFMTSSIHKRIIGVRSIQLRQNKQRNFGFALTLKYWAPSKTTGQIVKYFIRTPFTFNEIYEKTENPDILSWADKLNTEWNKFATKFNSLIDDNDVDTLGVKIDKYQWKSSYNENTRNYTIELVPVNGVTATPIEYAIASVTPDLNNTDIKFSETEYSTTDPTYKAYKAKLPKITIPGPLESYEEYLVAASFVGQTSNSYLGYTNMTFVPPKLYELTSTDQSFWIELSSPIGLQPRELPTDGSDLLILEIQLLYEPYSTKL